MLKTALLALMALAIASFGGGASLWYMLARPDGFGAVTVGDWATYPDSGTADADPYSRARSSTEAQLSLGRAEGLSFVAHRDADGAAMTRDCTYAIRGQLPSARAWTLSAGQSAPTLNSYGVLYNGDGAVGMIVGPQISPGNWMKITGDGPLRLVLTLYDTPAVSRASLSDLVMPGIVKVRCGV